MVKHAFFGVENDEPAPAFVQVPGSPSEHSSTSDNDDDKKRKGTAPSRERITLQSNPAAETEGHATF